MVILAQFGDFRVFHPEHSSPTNEEGTVIVMDRKRALPILSGLVAVLMLSFSGGCSDDPTSPEFTNLTIRLTDAPSDELEEANIFFVDLTVKRRGEAVERDVPLVLQAGDNPLNILELANKIIPFAAGSVDPGTYEFIKINLDQDQSFVIEKDGDRKALRIPSEEVKILGRFEVQQDRTTTVTLDFEADSSLLKTGPPQAEGGWLLRPVIAIEAR